MCFSYILNPLFVSETPIILKLLKLLFFINWPVLHARIFTVSDFLATFLSFEKLRNLFFYLAKAIGRKLKSLVCASVCDSISDLIFYDFISAPFLATRG